jgi:hypothetical protein
MQLARDLHMSRSRLLAEMDGDEITDWLAYYIVSDKKQKNVKYEEDKKILQAKFKTVMGGKIVKKGK